MSARVLFEPRDLWLGVYWERTLLPPGFSCFPGRSSRHWRVYICLLPALPIMISWERPT